MSAAFFGLIVTEDLLWLFGGIALAGALNFLIGLADEKEVRLASAQATKNETKLDELHALWSKQFPGTEIPFRLRNLKGIPNSELRQMAGQISSQMRASATAKEEAAKTIPYWELVPNYHSLSEEEKKAAFNEVSFQAAQQHSARTYKFNNEQRPDALAIWEELKARTTVEKHPNRRPIAIEDGMLAGIRPIEESATAIEKLARQLGE